MSQYVSTALWTKGRNGIAGAQGAEQTIGFSAPVEFQGRAGEWTPEHFLMAAVAGCFTTTFAAIAEFSKFRIHVAGGFRDRNTREGRARVPVHEDNLASGPGGRTRRRSRARSSPDRKDRALLPGIAVATERSRGRAGSRCAGSCRGHSRCRSIASRDFRTSSTRHRCGATE